MKLGKRPIIYSSIIIVLALLCIYGFVNLSLVSQDLKVQKQLLEKLNKKNNELIEILKENVNDFSKQKRHHKETLDSLRLEYKLDSLFTCISQIDLDSFVLHINKIDEKEFKSISKNNTTTKFEDLHFSNNNIERKDQNAWRLNDSIFVIRLESNQLDSIKNQIPRKNEQGFSNYSYQGFVKLLNSFLFTGQYLDAWDLVLINAVTGKRTHLKHHMVISPDDRSLISYAWDGWTLYSGGFKMYEIEDGELNLKINYYPSESVYEKKGFYWSFSDIYILSENEFAFIVQFNLIKGRTLKAYAKLEIEKTATNNG